MHKDEVIIDIKIYVLLSSYLALKLQISEEKLHMKHVYIHQQSH